MREPIPETWNRPRQTQNLAGPSPTVKHPPFIFANAVKNVGFSRRYNRTHAFSQPTSSGRSHARRSPFFACSAAHGVAQQAVPVVVASSGTMQTAAGQPFVGTVLPARTSDVGSAVDGRLVDMPIVDGQHVEENEPIAQLLRGLLEIEKAGAVAELNRRRELLAELQAGSRPEEIEQARAAVAGLEARVAYAEGRLVRLERLAERGTSTADELQDAQAELLAVSAQLRGSRSALALVAAGPRQEQIAQAAAAAAVQEAEVLRIDDQLAKHTIRAPFSG